MLSLESLAALIARTGDALGTSDWVTITQDRIDAFADATGDHQWIHVDPEQAATSPYRTTIAHGLLTLGLVPGLTRQIFEVKGIRMGINYGVNKVRFPAPVPAGSRVRAHVTLAAAEEIGSEGAQVVIAATIEVEGNPKPACVAEIVLRFLR